jgi:hypothetical protein
LSHISILIEIVCNYGTCLPSDKQNATVILIVVNHRFQRLTLTLLIPNYSPYPYKILYYTDNHARRRGSSLCEGIIINCVLCAVLEASRSQLKSVTNKEARPLIFLCIMLVIKTVTSMWDLWRKSGNERGFSPVFYFTCLCQIILGPFAKLRKATIRCVVYVDLSVCNSVRPPLRMEQICSHWTEFHDI